MSGLLSDMYMYYCTLHTCINSVLWMCVLSVCLCACMYACMCAFVCALTFVHMCILCTNSDTLKNQVHNGSFRENEPF